MMNIKVGLKWKGIEGIGKGKYFVVLKADNKEVIYKSIESSVLYSTNRKHFEKYILRVNKYWNERNKKYKANKGKIDV